MARPLMRRRRPWPHPALLLSAAGVPSFHQVLAAKPKKGNAVLFHSIKPTGELERLSLHTACPVLKGVK